MKILSHILLFISLCGFAQTKLSESLIAIHYDPDHKSDLKQVIYKYNFVNHVYNGKEVVMTFNGKKDGKDYVRFDEGENIVYQNRYLVSPRGYIIDLEDKVILHDAPAKVIRCTNDSVIFFINDVFSGAYYSYYNLKTRKYADIPSKDFKPNIGQNVEFDQQKSPYKLFYYPKGGDKTLLMEDAGHGGVSSVEKKQDIPIHWIDDDSFLFPYIKITDLEGSVVKYTISNKKTKIIGSFNSTSKLSAAYKFQSGLNGLIEFSFKDKLYLINPVKETMLISFYKEIGTDYSVSVDAKAGSRSIYYKGVEIGKNNFEINNFKASENYAAIICNVKMGASSYKRDLSVYSAFKGKWETIFTENIVSIAGWIKQ